MKRSMGIVYVGKKTLLLWNMCTNRNYSLLFVKSNIWTVSTRSLSILYNINALWSSSDWRLFLEGCMNYVFYFYELEKSMAKKSSSFLPFTSVHRATPLCYIKMASIKQCDSEGSVKRNISTNVGDFVKWNLRSAKVFSRIGSSQIWENNRKTVFPKTTNILECGFDIEWIGCSLFKMTGKVILISFESYKGLAMLT